MSTLQNTIKEYLNHCQFQKRMDAKTLKYSKGGRRGYAC